MQDLAFADTLIGQRIGGRYVVEKILGAGGMGVVALARYPELGQKVAIKFLLPMLAADPVVTARFVREARLAAMVKSEHFVRVFDIGKLPDGTPYLVMEFLAGKDLSVDLAERGALPIDEAVDVILQAAVGIAEIHGLGVVHRDLKPSNLFLAEAAGKRLVKVLDFGISKERTTDSEAPLTATNHLLGTPQYMSPEQVRASKDVDARSDIWSLGVILYELVTKQRPFTTTDAGVGEIFAKVLYIDPTPPRELRSELPEGLEALIMRCLAREPGERFVDVGELAAALRPFAPEHAAHLADIVRQALATRRSAPPPPLPADDAEPPIGHLPTVVSSPSPKGAAPTVPSGGRLRHVEHAPDAPVTAMTAAGDSSRTASTRGVRSAVVVAAIALVALVVVVGVVVSRSDRPQPAKLAPPATAAATEVPSASAEPAVATEPAVTTAANAEPAPLPSGTPSAASSVKRTAPPKPPARTSAPAAATAPRPKPASDPILDRK